MIRRRVVLPNGLALFRLLVSLTVVANGCGGHRSATTVAKGIVPVTTANVYLATSLGCRSLRSESARFTPLVVRGPDYTTTIEPIDGCRRQRYGGPTASGVTTSGHWYSYLYGVPLPASGEVRLTPGNQPTATLNAAKFEQSHAATIYYVNCKDYYADCPEGRGYQGRISLIEYFKDDDVQEAP
jgi:hypothetical protein